MAMLVSSGWVLLRVADAALGPQLGSMARRTQRQEITLRRFWLKRRPMVHRWFGDHGRANPARHWGMTFSEWYREALDLRKRLNPFVKRPWLLRNVDRHGRPRKHPLFQDPENQATPTNEGDVK
jgi:hypothetical protein